MCIQARRLYNESICWSTPDSELLGKCLSNRSAVYFETGHHLEVIADIRLALENPFTGGKRAKIFLRLIKSYISLNMMMEAKTALVEAIESTEMTAENLGGGKYKEFVQITSEFILILL